MGKEEKGSSWGIDKVSFFYLSGCLMVIFLCCDL